jgi:FkbM family methyltransferase
VKIPQFAKTIGKKTLFKEVSVRTVLWGPCRGIRYKIFSGYGWAYLYGGWERPVVRVMCSLINPGSVAYDLGANYGMHTLLFTRLVGRSGHVYSFEPNPEVFAALENQLRLNDITTATPVCKAISAKSGEASFDVAHHRGAGHLTSSGEGGCKVQVTSIDDFVFGCKERPPAFLKIDIEGGESGALEGACKVLSQYRPTMVVELHNPDEDRRVGAILKSMKYKAFRVKDGSRVEDLGAGWPDPKGLWGIVSCLPDRC